MAGGARGALGVRSGPGGAWASGHRICLFSLVVTTASNFGGSSMRIGKSNRTSKVALFALSLGDFFSASMQQHLLVGFLAAFAAQQSWAFGLGASTLPQALIGSPTRHRIVPALDTTAVAANRTASISFTDIEAKNLRGTCSLLTIMTGKKSRLRPIGNRLARLGSIHRCRP